MLVNTKIILEKARINDYAIAHTNICDLHTLRAVIKTCKELKVPVIIALAEDHFKYLSIEEACSIVTYYGSKTDIPVALHLDHGKNIKTVKKAIQNGFTSVMIDGSNFPFAENVNVVSDVVDLAHYYGITVEAELGHVGIGEQYEANNEELRNLYTKPAEAKEFACKTGVDSLAIAIGTAHGEYKGKPEIDFDRLVEIRKSVDIPLVLHGSSGTGLDNIKKCVELGINKVNIFTDLAKSANKYIRENIEQLDYTDMTLNMEDEIARCLKSYLQVLNPKIFTRG